MKVKEQFERYAISYREHSIIQNKIAKILVDEIDFSPKTILDLGCGDGRIFNQLTKKCINFNYFYAVDFANSMINLHPNNPKIEKILGDFNKKELFNTLSKKEIDLAISSSALQWANDLNFTFNQISTISKSGLFFLFSSNTFKTMHSTLGVKSPIHSQEAIIKAFNSSFIAKKIEIYNFKLDFDNTLEMLRYIKRSGVSGGLRVGYKELKSLIENYPKSYLEFEAILLKGKSKC